MGVQRLETELLACAGRLLLEYNESSGEIHHTLVETASALSKEKLDVAISYGGIVVSLGNDAPVLKPVREFRYNATLQARIHAILIAVCHAELEAAPALAQLERAESETPRHSRPLAIVIFGAAAACLAVLLGADAGAALVIAASAGLGLLARQELGRRHFSLLTLPFTAAFIGAVLGGIAIRLGWTKTPALVLIVPSLMLVPGPHLINGLLDLVDNFLPMSIARLGLATGILIASALGIVLGIELTLSELPYAQQGVGIVRLNLLSDMLLAGVVTCGFAMYYNAAWPHIGMAMLGGMVGHGLRFLALEAGWRLEAATFVGGLAVGAVCALIGRSYKTPFAVIAFAGAVTMMPGMQMYRALGGALQLAQLRSAATLPILAEAIGNASQASFVVGALAIGLLVAARAVTAFASDTLNGAQFKE
jgi:uncharacterized membrane protein YjjP (DUF1212 family)